MLTKHAPRIVRQRFYSTALAKTVPVVTVPQYVKDHVERQKRKEKLKLLQVAKVKPIGGNKAFPLITGQRSDFDFYLGQMYPKNRRIPLISEHWMKKNTSGQKFTIHKQNRNPSLPVVFNRPGIDDNYQFSQFGLKEEIVESLKNQGIVYPSPPQTQVIPEILENKNVLFVAESGSGKTLAYVTPVLHSISSLKKKIWCQPNTPFAVVVVPGKELAEQVAEEAYSVAEPCGIDVRVLVSGGTKYEHLVPKDNTNVDLLVGTFGILKKLFQRKVFSMRNIHHVVLDEADTLLDDSFNEDLLQFLQYVMAYNDEAQTDLMTPKAQLVLASSTWPTDYDKILSELLPVEEVKKVISPHAHRLMPHVTHKFHRVRDMVRAGALLELVKNDVSRKLPVMIFSNRYYTCDWMSGFLEDSDVPNEKFHSEMPIQRRTAAFNNFRDGIVHAFCCTDLASRGLDFQWVRHVINFDFPHNMSDYIHRCGRIGRLGTNHGHITNLVNSVPGAVRVQEIEMAVRTCAGLPSIDANIKKKIEKLKYRTQYES